VVKALKLLMDPLTGFNGNIEKVNEEKKKIRGYGKNIWT